MIKLNSESGFILPTIIIVSILLTMVSVAVSDLAVNNLRLSFQEQYRLAAQFAADAGADFGIVSLNQDNTWTTTAGEVVLFQ